MSTTPTRARRGRPSKGGPLAAFEQNIADAERLVLLSAALKNGRKRGMRRERREAISSAVRASKRDRALLEIAENDDLLIVCKPNSGCSLKHFEESELRPLLRQAVVATAAAVESYVSEKAKSYVAGAYKADQPPKGLRNISLTIEDLLAIERDYERRSWGHYSIIWTHLEQMASANPDAIGLTFSVVGKTGIWKKVDASRKVKVGESERQLRALADRRNIIAHTGDRRGGGKSNIDASEVGAYLANARSIVEALEAVLA